MAIIQNALMQSLSDRLAQQVKLILQGIRDARVVGGGEHFTRVTTSEDYQVENDFIDDAYGWDKYVSGQYIFPDITEISDYINVFNTHATNRGAPDLDRFLQTSGIDVADYFADLYYWVRGNRLSGRQVFYSSVLDPLATLEVVSSGVATFTDGFELGSPGANNSYVGRDDRTALETAGENFECYVSGTDIGNNGLGVTITVKGEDGVAVTRNVTFAANAPAYTLQTVGTASDYFQDVTNMQLLSGSNAGDTVVVRSKPLRTIAL